MSRKVIAVDLDRTLCEDASLGPPNPKVVSLIQELLDERHFIVIYTARIQADYHEVAAWLARHCVHYDAIVLGKLRFDVLIDDRTVHPDDVALSEQVHKVLNGFDTAHNKG